MACSFPCSIISAHIHTWQSSFPTIYWPSGLKDAIARLLRGRRLPSFENRSLLRDVLTNGRDIKQWWYNPLTKNIINLHGFRTLCDKDLTARVTGEKSQRLLPYLPWKIEVYSRLCADTLNWIGDTNERDNNTWHINDGINYMNAHENDIRNSQDLVFRASRTQGIISF